MGGSIGSNIGSSVVSNIGCSMGSGIGNSIAFIKTAIVSFGHQHRQFWVVIFRTLMQLENQSFTKISHLLK